MLLLRTLLTSALSLVAAYCMRSWGGDVPWQLYIPTGLLIASAALVHHRHIGSQLLVRAVLWSNLLLGVLIFALGDGHERTVAAILAGATTAGLLLLGRNGLAGDARGARFVPVAFRSTLTAILVMALADAQTLLLFGTLMAGDSSSLAGTGATSLVLAGALFLALAGLYSLKVWGLFLNLLSCAAIITVNALGLLQYPPLFRAAFIATAALQIVLAIPLLVAIAKRAQPIHHVRTS